MIKKIFYCFAFAFILSMYFYMSCVFFACLPFLFFICLYESLKNIINIKIEMFFLYITLIIYISSYIYSLIKYKYLLKENFGFFGSQYRL